MKQSTRPNGDRRDLKKHHVDIESVESQVEEIPNVILVNE